MGRLIITVIEINGHCPVYQVGDKIILDEGYQINLKESDHVCMHSLASIMPYYIALYQGVEPKKLGLFYSYSLRSKASHLEIASIRSP